MTSIVDKLLSLFRWPKLSKADVEQILAQKATGHPEKLDWRNSVVDLLKLLDMDSSLEARMKMAADWGYTGALDGSADMNNWLHRKVLEAVGNRSIAV
jgi:Domain of unknown function (DUF3597)